MLPIFSKEKIKLNPHSSPKKKPQANYGVKKMKKKRWKKDVKLFNIIML